MTCWRWQKRGKLIVAVGSKAWKIFWFARKLIMGAVEALADKLIRKSTVFTKLNEKYEMISFMMFLYCGKMSLRRCWLADSSCDKKCPASSSSSSSSSVWLFTVNQGKEVLSASDLLWYRVIHQASFRCFLPNPYTSVTKLHRDGRETTPANAE